MKAWLRSMQIILRKHWKSKSNNGSGAQTMAIVQLQLHREPSEDCITYCLYFKSMIPLVTLLLLSCSYCHGTRHALKVGEMHWKDTSKSFIPNKITDSLTSSVQWHLPTIYIFCLLGLPRNIHLIYQTYSLSIIYYTPLPFPPFFASRTATSANPKRKSKA